jgi:hypothetical protein
MADASKKKCALYRTAITDEHGTKTPCRRICGREIFLLICPPHSRGQISKKTGPVLRMSEALARVLRKANTGYTGERRSAFLYPNRFTVYSLVIFDKTLYTRACLRNRRAWPTGHIFCYARRFFAGIMGLFQGKSARLLQTAKTMF